MNELFSRGGLKQSLWTGSVHFLRRPTVITWLSVPCVRDAISLICLFLSQERRGGDLCRSVSPLLRSEIRRESYCLCCTVIYSHSCCKQPLPLSSPSHLYRQPGESVAMVTGCCISFTFKLLGFFQVSLSEPTHSQLSQI